MRKKMTLLAAAVILGGSFVVTADEPTTKPAVPAALDFTMKRLDGTDQPLSAYSGKVLLFVNVASKCGFTKQYTALEALNKKYADQGLKVVGFPSNNFKNQEPGTDAEIAEFCKLTYGVTFDMFSKVDVKGEAQTPLYKYLTNYSSETVKPGEIGWNFEKFLIGRDGTIVARFKSKVTPDDPELIKALEAELSKPAPAK